MSLENRITRLEQRMGVGRGADAEQYYTLGAGTDYEMEVPARLWPTPAQIYKGAPGADPAVLAAYNRHRADRRAEVEATLVMFEDEKT